MKIPKIKAFSVFVLISCACCGRLDKTHKMILGNWAGYSPETGYYEVYFDTLYYRYFSEAGVIGFGPDRHYIFENDTLLDESNSPLAGIQILGRNKMIMKYAFRRNKRVAINSLTGVDTLYRIPHSTYTLNQVNPERDLISVSYLSAYRDRKRSYIMHMMGISEQEYEKKFRHGSPGSFADTLSK